MVRKRSCSVAGCENKQGQVEGVKFHSIPSAPGDRRSRWLRACALSPNDPQSYIFVCSAHFVGGAGPTVENPDPVVLQPITPLREAALDGLMSLSTEYISSPSPSAQHTPCRPDSNDMCVKDMITFLCTFIRSLPDEIPRKGDAGVALMKLISFLQGTKSADEGKTLDGPFVVEGNNETPVKEAEDGQMEQPKTQKVKRSLLSTLKDTSFQSEECGEPLPFIPPTPPNNKVGGSTCASPQEMPAISATSYARGRRSFAVQCVRAPIDFYHCKQSTPQKFHFFTGMTKANFEVMYQFLGGDAVCSHLKYSYHNDTPVKNLNSCLSPRDRMFMTLLRLRRGVPYEDLAYLFGISVGNVSAIVYTCIRFMAVRCNRIRDRLFVTTEAQDAEGEALFDKFPNLRVIIDTVEFKIQHPYHFQMQSNTYSNYKSTNTIKYLIGISRSGAISFVSKGFEGSASDKQIVVESGLLEKLQEHDAVMADRGFVIVPELNEINVDLYVPSYLDQRSNLAGREELQSKSVASLRNFVEIANKRIRDFRTLRGALSNNKLIPILDDMVFIAAFISNFDERFVPVVPQ